MAWYRIAVADYPVELGQDVFCGEPNERIPRHIALETSSSAEAPKSVNLIYYIDVEGEECGDFHFESIQEALDWSKETLKLERCDFKFYEPFLAMEAYLE